MTRAHAPSEEALMRPRPPTQEAEMPELTRRYIVMAMATDGPFDLKDPEAPFVLKPWKDPAAVRALAAYRDVCYPALAEELTKWVEAISAGPVIRGGVGVRNEQHMAARAKPSAKAVGKPRQPPRVKTPPRVKMKAPPRVKMKVAEPKVRKKRGKR